MKINIKENSQQIGKNSTNGPRYPSSRSGQSARSGRREKSDEAGGKSTKGSTRDPRADLFNRLASPRRRPKYEDINRRKDPYKISPAALNAIPSQRIQELAEPKRLYFLTEADLMEHIRSIELKRNARY